MERALHSWKRYLKWISVVLVLLPQEALLLFLSGSFDKASTQNKYLKIYETRTGFRSCLECSRYCLMNDDLSSPCLAYECHPLDRTCVFYSKGEAQVPPPGVEVFLFKATDTFHTISINEQLFSLFLSSMTKPFLDARAHCNSLGGYLLQFDSLEEYDAVKTVVNRQHDGSQLKFTPSSSSAYVGVNDLITEGEWLTDREGVAMGVWQWTSGEPNNADDKEDCAVIRFDSWTLNDMRCDDLRRFLCEKD